MWWISVAMASDPLLETDATVFTLDNGLRVILEEQRRTDVVALHMRMGVAARDEVDGELGCAHLFEHLMFEGSENVPGGQFDALLTAAGGGNNAWTSEDITAYHMTFPSGATDLALYLESDRLGFLSAGVTAENVANQRSVVLQERAEGYAQPHGRDWDAFTRLMWPEGHPYHVPIIGTVADIEGFSVEGTQNFWEKHYRSQNAVLALVGNFDTAEMEERIRFWYSDVPDRGEAPQRQADVPLPEHNVNGYIEDRIEDWGMMMGWNTPPRLHEDSAALEVLSYVLSYGRGTRLDDAMYYNLRYGTESWAWLNGGDIGSGFVIYVAANKSKLVPMAKRVNKVLASVISSPPTPEEMSRAIASIRAEYLSSIEQPEGRAEVLADCLADYGRPDCMAERLAAYEAVTAADLARVTQEWLSPDRRVTLSVVPEGRGGALPNSVPVELP